MKKVWLLLLFVGLFTGAIAQESSCNDGVDNDGDGFIDCFDSDCANNVFCNDSYIGKDKACQAPPTSVSQFQMTLKTTSPVVSTTHGRFAVGDMGGPGGKDGIPEVVTVHAGTRKFYILDGITFAIKYQANTTAAPERFDIAIGNVNNDGCAEAFFVENSAGAFYVAAYDCQANLIWREKAYGRPFTLGLADLDHDGKVEIYYRNEIRDAATGQRLVVGTGNWDAIDAGPVAVDMLADGACAECAGLELVLGGEISSVKLPTGRTLADTDQGSVTVVKRYNDIPTVGTDMYFPKLISLGPKFVNSQTSVADYNLDGNFDVLMTGATGSTTGQTTIFFWDVTANTFKTYKPLQSNGTGWVYGAGRLNLADLDGDGKMNAAFVSGSRLFVLDENLNILKIKSKITGLDSADWIKPISEVSSGFTSTTVFDFNNDNASEIVYRDEKSVFIFNGKTGAPSPPVACGSLTTNDYPIVTDVDGDGSTEICVICDNGGGSNTGEVRAYKSALQPWVSARKVWNQHGYFNVNVNDDLSIPRFQQKHFFAFSNGVCGPGPNRALNSFLNQSAILDSKGCKTYPTADLTFEPSPNLINVIPPSCPDKDFKVSFTLKNIGDVALTGNIPITFYKGDPRLVGAVKLNTTTVAVANFKKGDLLAFSNITVNGTGGNFTMFAVLNDNGSTVPTPIKLPNSGFAECDYINNVVSVPVKSNNFILSTVSKNHIQCNVTGSASPNGSAEAFKLEGITKRTVGLTFYWFNGPTPGDSTLAVYKGPVRSPLINGTYTVYAFSNAQQCGSDTVRVVVGLSTQTISATIVVLNDFTDCEDPDGELEVRPVVGTTSDYTYQWFEGTVFGTSPILSTSQILKKARGLTYSVLVTEKATGCETLESGTVPDKTNRPVVNAISTAANCNPPNTGSATADVGGTVKDYFFYWYIGSAVKPTADFKGKESAGSTYSGLSPGNYTVVAEDDETECLSNPFIVVVAAPAGITASTTITSHETSCAAPNGAASANVGGITAGFTFKWFNGNNTLPANQIATTANVSGLASGQYTVEATRTTSGCTDTDLITINEIKVIPTVTASVTSHQTNCFPPNGSVTATAGVSAGPHTFYWFNGSVGTPDTTASNFKGATYAGRTAAFYTVVVVDKITRCPAVKAVVQVLDNTSNPVMTTATVDQTSCVVASPNGSALANIGGVTAGFKFRWFSGADTTTFITQAASIVNRAAGTYTVKAVNLTTGCFSTKIITITELAAKPVLSLSKSDNSTCSAAVGFNGSVTSSLTLNPNFQAAHTLVYAWQKNAVVIAGQTGSSINTLNGAFYTATVTNQNLGCTSDPVVIEVKDVFTIPAITTSMIASTNCATGTPNGSATVSSVAPAGPVEYRWYTGTTVGAAGTELNGSAPFADPTASLLQGGVGRNYIVEVTLTSTGCKNTATLLLADNSALPVLGPLSKFDNTKCANPRDGQAILGTVTYKGTPITFPNAAYTIAWSNGGNTSTISALPAGTYTVTVRKNDVSCTSDPASIQVQDNLTDPDITTNTTSSTNCTGGAPNGSVTATVTPANPVEYRWYAGGAVGAPGSEINTPFPPYTNATASNLQGGAGRNYTVEVTYTATQCKNTATVLLGDASEKPVITLATINNTICDSTRMVPVGNYNGSVTVQTITYKGNPFGGAVAYKWFKGVGTTTPISSATAVTLPNKDDGFYSATVTMNALNCVSDFLSAEVKDNLTLPSITFTTTASTNCALGTDNGTATATVTGLPAQSFAHVWHKGNLVTDPAVGGNSPLLTAQQGGRNYTLEAKADQTGCQNNATATILDDSKKPVITPLSRTDNTNCTAPFNGTATVNAITPFTYRGSTITSTYTGFTLAWSGGTIGPVDQITTLAAGTYTLTVTAGNNPVTGNNDNCISDPVSVTVIDNLTIPVVSTNILNNQTSCDATAPNGQIEATVAGGPGGFTFDWFNGIGTGGAPVSQVSTGRTVQTLTSADYTVRVRNNATRCTSTETVFVPNNIVNPSIALGAVGNVTRCDTPNGQATPTLGSITTFPTTNFRIFYVRTFSDPGNPASPPSSPAVIKASTDTYASTSAVGPGNPPVVTGLSPGFLTALVLDNNTKCESSPVTVKINDATLLNTVNIFGTPAAGFCLGAGGGIQITVGGGTGGKTFEWFKGTPTNSNINFFNNLPAFSTASITTTQDLGMPLAPPGVSAGSYTVVVKDAVGCGTYLTSNVPFAGMPTVNIGKSDVIQCAAPFDGAINVGLTGTPGVFYDIILYRGNSPGTMINSITGSLQNATLNTPALQNGDYLVRVIDNTPANIACPLDFPSALVKRSFNPFVTIDQINANTACDLTSADGSVRITAAQDPRDTRPVGPLVFQVANVTPTPVNPPAYPALLGSGAASATQTLNYGFRPLAYTIRVVESSSGCFTDQSVNIPDQPVISKITLGIVNESFCAPNSNGSAQVTAVNPAAITDYQYTWYSDSTLTTFLYQANGTGTPAGGEMFRNGKAGYALGSPGLGSGTKTYYVRAKRLTGSGIGCNSQAAKVVIQDTHVTPVATLTILPNTSCDPTLGEGSIAIQTTSAGFPAFPATSYAYDINPDPIAVGTLVGQNGGVTTQFTRLTSNTYTLTAVNETSGCKTTPSITIINQIFPINISNQVINPKLICNLDGDITATEITINRSLTGQAAQVFPAAGALAANFEFRWFKGSPAAFSSAASLKDGNGVPATITGNLLNVGAGPGNYLDPSPTNGTGTYYVIARQLSGAGRSGAFCESAPLMVEIKDQSVKPLVTLTPFTNTSCAPASPEGEIRVNVTDASVVPPAPAFSYNYAWTGPTPPATANFDGNNNPFTALQDGVYQLTATNITTGCVTVSQTTVQKNTTPIFVANVKSEAQLFCTPSGSLEVQQINFNDRTGASQIVTGAGLGQFSFAWFRDGTAPANLVGGSTGLLDSAAANYPGIGADPDYYIVATRNTGAPGLNCSSAPFRVAIVDKREFPVVTFATIANTSCDNQFDGQITTTAATAGFGSSAAYDFNWTGQPALTTITNGTNSASPYTTPGTDRIGPGTYSLTVVNSTTQCSTNATVSVLQNAGQVTILTAGATPQERCIVPGDGTAAVSLANVRVNGAVAGAGTITFAWQNGVGAGIGATPTINNLNAGLYFVSATRNSGNSPASGCSSAPFKVEVKDERQYPVVTFATVANTSCDTNFDGEITVRSVTAGIGAGSSYDFDWTSDPGGAVVVSDALNRVSPYTTPAADNIGPGAYGIRVRNTTTQCFTDATVTLIQNTPSVAILAVTKVDQRDCAPFDGSITVDAANATNVSLTGTYTFTWRKGIVPLATPVPANVLSQIDAGTYFVTGTKTNNIGSGCVTPPFPVEILDLRANPVVDMLSLANVACNTSYTGQVSATVTEGTTTGITAGYNFEWFRGLNNTTMANFLGTGTSLSNRQQGDYTVRVTDNASPGRSCINTATLPIVFESTDFTSALSAIMQTLCSPTQNGNLTVNTVTETIGGITTNYIMSNAADRVRFSFQWLDSTSTAITPVVNGANTLNNVLAGQYYVQVTNNLGCISLPSSGVINDDTAPPVISLDDFLNPTVCLLPETPGHLQVSADNSLNFSDYVFTWFTGPNTTGPMVVADNPGLNNIFYNNPQEYTVRVSNKATNCQSLQTYRFTTDTLAIKVIASSVALTNCTSNNGSLFAAIPVGNGNLFNYEWYTGTIIDGTPDFITKEVLTAPLGIFTVIAKNPNHNFCVSVPDMTEVLDGREFPPVDIEQKNPVTYCDPTNPNGVAKATVNGQVDGYIFNWYQGAAVAGNSFYTGTEAAGLSPVTYSVEATNLISGCVASKSIQITFNPTIVPLPSVVILSHRTNCVIPDGQLQTVISGNFADYTIQWYNGRVVKNQTDFNGEFYRALDAGPFTTTVTEIESGCVSTPIITEVLPFMKLPEFNIETVPTNCEVNVGEAYFIPLNDVDIGTIEWNISGFIQTGTILTELPKGEFTVTVTSVQQCVSTKTFEIRPEILVFNGVSRNGDGQNDIFEISCIGDFPNNNVKIFNRAGTLVYESERYDNTEVFFSGTSNKGINLMGTELPEGTYFYIVNKGDGSKPRTGYLELLR